MNPKDFTQPQTATEDSDTQSANAATQAATVHELIRRIAELERGHNGNTEPTQVHSNPTSTTVPTQMVHHDPTSTTAPTQPLTTKNTLNEIQNGQEGSQEGSQDGSQEGSQEGSQDGSQEGSQEGSQDGSQEGSQDGSQEGSQDGSQEAKNSIPITQRLAIFRCPIVKAYYDAAKVIFYKIHTSVNPSDFLTKETPHNTFCKLAQMMVSNVHIF
jgi:flagellar biosynthesis/type III secretory pathway protein FliH